jgi:DNA-binding NtrC family response regulator
MFLSLGRLLLERGSPSAADAAFANAAEQAERVDAALVASARIWQAAARTDAAQLTAAESLCRAALLTDALDETERARGEATLARVLLWQQRGAEAAALGITTRPTGDPFVEATAVRVLLSQGAPFEAGLRARGLLNGIDGAEPSIQLVALGAHLRVLLATGDLTLGEACLRELTQAARAARCPLRAARARLLWLHALRRAGQLARAEGELRKLVRMRRALPPLLRSAVEQALRQPGASGISEARRETAVLPSALELVVQIQQDEDDQVALRHVCERLLRGSGATRVDLWTADAGPPTASIQCGSGLPTQLGPRALEAGIAIGPEAVAAGREAAAPVRLGSRLLAAISVRWSTDRTPPADFAALMSLACAVSAPRVESMLHHRQETVRAATAIPELVGVSSTILEVRKAIGRAASAPFSVLIEGESGVGKELVARAVHQLGPRRDRRFCDVNCAALPDDLLESELFGHTRGAFTGAIADRGGLVEEADGGTLFLDEVADLSPRAQAKLLRVVQQQEVRRVGETFSRKVDVRFVSAANRDLRVEAEQGRFRQDLVYRLDVIRIRIPPLRERPDDIPVLACHFWRTAAPRVGTCATLAHDVLAALSRHHWPGNVRELQNVISSLAVEAPLRGRVRAAALPAAIGGNRSIAIGRLMDARLLWERRFVELALARAGGNRSRAARELGLTRQGLLKVLTRVGLAADTDPR